MRGKGKLIFESFIVGLLIVIIYIIFKAQYSESKKAQDIPVISETVGDPSKGYHILYWETPVETLFWIPIIIIFMVISITYFLARFFIIKKQSNHN